jgi:hypothetical protein
VQQSGEYATYQNGFGLITVVPVSQQIQILRLLLKLQQPDSEPVEVFKHKLMKSLVKMNDIKSVCSNSKTMREIQQDRQDDDDMGGFECGQADHVTDEAPE